VDFAGLWRWLGEPFVEAVLRAYGVATDPGLRQRARFLALCGAIEDGPNAGQIPAGL
jgi:hypothetical protein